MYRKTYVKIDLESIKHNLTQMKETLKNDEVNLIAVVKANAYGHGIIEVSNFVVNNGADMLAVATLDEAVNLRKNGIVVPILVLGHTDEEFAEVAAEYKISLTAYNHNWLLNVSDNLKEKTLKIHIKCDTGMNRIGIRFDDTVEMKRVVEVLNNNSSIEVEGLFTHFARADETNNDLTEKQYQRFKNMIKLFEDNKIKPRLIHCGNSAYTLRFPDKVWNAVRFGISLYGLTPSIDIKDEIPFQLKSAFSLYSYISNVKRIKKGETVGYGVNYTVQEDELIGTVPIGYADGLRRKYGKYGGYVLIDGVECPIVGTICMDQMMVKLSKPVQIGEKVTIIGKQQEKEITVEQVAEICDTINYEIICNITNRVPRIYK